MGLFGNWFKRESYKSQEEIDTEKRKMQEALGMNATEVENLKKVEEMSQAIAAEAKQTEQKVMNLASKMKLTDSHFNAQMALIKHTAAVAGTRDLIKAKRKAVSTMDVSDIDNFRDALDSLNQELVGLLASTKQIQEEAVKEKEAGKEVLSTLEQQMGQVIQLENTYSRIKKAAKKVVEDLGRLEDSSGKIAEAAISQQTIVKDELAKFRQQAA